MVVGKVVKAKGTCGIYADSRISKKYYSIVIKDATACCSQGLEFVLKDDKYPSKGKIITVEYTFSTYREVGNIYCQKNGNSVCQRKRVRNNTRFLRTE